MITRAQRNKCAKGLCATPRCRRNRTARNTKCNTCRSRNYDARFPMRRLYRNLKSSAKRRWITFAMPLPCFELFATFSGLSERHGKTAGALTVDRRFSFAGYFIGNVQALTLSENSRKRWTDSR